MIEEIRPGITRVRKIRRSKIKELTKRVHANKKKLDKDIAYILSVVLELLKNARK